MTGIRPYDRRSGFLYTDDIVKVVDYNGDEAVFIVARHEAIAQHSVRYTSRVANGGIAPGAEVFAEWRCLQPARENRLFEFRPFIFGVREVLVGQGPATTDGRLILGPTPINQLPIGVAIQADYVDERIPVGVELRWRHPTGVARLGTDLSFNVDVVVPTATITTPNVGGVQGGFIDAILTPLVDDFSDLWKLNAIYGQSIELGIANRTNIYATPGVTIGGNGMGANIQYFIGVVGRKHLLGPCPEKFYDKVMNEEIPYKTVTIGGVPIVSTRA